MIHSHDDGKCLKDSGCKGWTDHTSLTTVDWKWELIQVEPIEFILFLKKHRPYRQTKEQ